MQILRSVSAGFSVIAGGSMVLCVLKLHEATNMVWGYSTPAAFDPWVLGLRISIPICLLAFLVAICPWCYRKDARTAYPAMAAEVETRACGLAGALGLPETAVTRRRGKGGVEIVIRLPPEGGG